MSSSHFEAFYRQHQSPQQAARVRAEQQRIATETAQWKLLGEVRTRNANSAGVPVERVLSPADAALCTDFLSMMKGRKFAGIDSLARMAGQRVGTLDGPVKARGYPIGYILPAPVYPFGRQDMGPTGEQPPLCAFLCTDGMVRAGTPLTGELVGSMPMYVDQSGALRWHAIQAFGVQPNGQPTPITLQQQLLNVATRALA